MLIIEIIEGFHVPEAFTTKDGATRYKQRAFAHFGGPFPVEIRLSIKDMGSYYKIGKYQLSPSSFRVGQWGDLQLNQFEISLQPLESANALKAVGDK